MKIWWKTKAAPWLKANWQWVLLPVGILLAVFKAFGGRKTTVVGSELTGAATVEREANEAATTEKLEAAAERTTEVVEARQEHEAALRTLSDEQREKVKELVDDPVALNNYLKDVGKKTEKVMSTQGIDIYTKLVQEVREEFPSFRIVNKEASKLMKTIGVLLRVLSFGFMGSFMTRFVTTVGYTVYVPSGWADRDYLLRSETIRHERVHMRQRKRMGSLPFSLIYLLWAFPVVLAIGRRNLEQEAYEESLRAAVEYFGQGVLIDPSFRGRIVKHFTSAEYLWMWPFRKSIEAWYDATVDIIRRDSAKTI